MNAQFKEGKFKNALKTFYIWLYRIRHMVKEVSLILYRERKPAIFTSFSTPTG